MIKSVAVLGAGAVGLFYGARLQKSRKQVEFLSRSGAGILAGNLLEAKSVWGNFTIKIKAYDSSAEMKPADLVIISMKAMPDIDYVSLVRPVLRPDSIVLLLQNGINQEENLSSFISPHQIYAGLAFTCIYRNNYHQIEHSDYGNIKIAPMLPENYANAVKLSKLFETAGVKCEAVKNYRHARWQKLLWNIPFNTISVTAGGLDTKQMMKSPSLKLLSELMMKEVQKIAEAEDIKITDAEIKDMMKRTEKMKPYSTSMLLDYQSDRELELEAILGEPLRLATKYGVKAPYMESNYYLLNSYQERHSNS